MEVAISQLQELGYTVHAEKLKSSDYGLPQRRNRVYIICLRDAFAEPPNQLMARISERIRLLQRPIKPLVIALSLVRVKTAHC